MKTVIKKKVTHKSTAAQLKIIVKNQILLR